MVYLDSEELSVLRAEARASGISLAELLRRLLRQHIEQRSAAVEPSIAAYLRIVGLGSSGKSDVAERHDVYLGQALLREHLR
jgi:hypothetical protein